MQSLLVAAEKRGWLGFAEKCLLQWHLCSLDAPTVAVVWAFALAQLAGVRLHGAQALVLGLGTWIVYVLDRVLDGAGARLSGSGIGPSLPDPARLRARHYFHHRHRQSLLALCCLAAGVLGILCFQLPVRLVLFYLALGLPVMAYGLRVHARLLWPERASKPAARAGRRKEAAVALLFTAAVAAPAFAGAVAARLPALFAASTLLALLCWFNCALISHAEDGSALRTRAHERKQLALAAILLACAAAGVLLWERASYLAQPSAGLEISPWNPAAAVLLSCLLLLTLLLGVRDMPSNASRLRVLADLGLLTPLLFLRPPF